MESRVESLADQGIKSPSESVTESLVEQGVPQEHMMFYQKMIEPFAERGVESTI